MSAITIHDLSKRFASTSGEVLALDSINLEISLGAIFGIVGTSGAGKSTLLRTINGLESPSSGEVVVLGQEVSTLKSARLRSLRRDVSMVFQHFNLLATQTVAQNVAMPLILAKYKKGDIAKRVQEVLGLVGLADRADYLPKQLSGGQRQRVGIARALVTDPKVLLCDEPTSALDPLTTNQILDLITKVNEELGITVVIITHEISVVSRIADEVAVMEGGRIIEQGEVAEVFSHPRAALSRRFVETVVPQRLPLAVAHEVSEGRYSTVVRVVHRGGSARGLISDLTRCGVDVFLLHAADAVLRRETVGTMVLGLNPGGGEGAETKALGLLHARPGIDVEVLN
ncbi:methionine ABC transporter ATP-binding protein [Corynebacterium flavescens]|uniref:methionine ABC transporter ATP-binding protein n=1 Tax=Corynebacterium flavescens TaxID=28028 RepID=UPI003FD26121